MKYAFPFELSNFLVPNKFDWKIENDDVVYSKYTKPIVMLGDYRWVYKFKKIIGRNQQIHLYANVWLLKELNDFYKTNFKYKQLYDELFKVSDNLNSRLNLIRNQLPSEYISLCFRHRNVFGDFSESNFEEVPDDEKERVLISCVTAIKDKIRTYHLPAVITSDSVNFLHAIKDIPNAYTVNTQNKAVHMDYVSGAEINVYEQSFIDFYILGWGASRYAI